MDKIQFTDLVVLLKDRDVYDLVSALRGPDEINHNSATIKSITTCVIRYALGMVSPPQVQSPTSARDFWADLREDERYNVARDWYDDSYMHFRQHIWSAYGALVQLGTTTEELKPVTNWITFLLGEFYTIKYGKVSS